MIRKLLFLAVLASLISSCGSSKGTSTSSRKRNTISNQETTSSSSKEATIADKVVWTAVTYKGVRYRYGGTTRKGMDCSGLIHTSFKKRNIYLPRTSYGMFKQGYEIPLRKVKRGDLLFFITAKRRNVVNHVGLVTSTDNNDIKFIHSTTSRGVIVSSLNMPYWKSAFYRAKRVLNNE